MLLALLALAWIVGIVSTAWFSPAPALLGVLIGLGLVSTGLGWHTYPVRRAGLMLVCAASGGLHLLLAQPEATPHSLTQLAAYSSHDIGLQGVVQADPRQTEETQQVLLETELASVDGLLMRIEGQVLLHVPPYPAYRYGQRLLVHGQLQQPRPARHPNQFDYRDYLARQGIFVLMYNPLVEVLPGVDGNPFLRGLLAFRTHCHARLLRMLPEPQASLAAGILLGLKATIPTEVRDSFAATGTAHILVVSGWHLSIVAMMLVTMTTHAGLSRRTTFIIVLASIWVYALFVGGTPSVLRAAVMASLTLFASTAERRAEPWTLLLLACFALTLLNPQILWNVGFQLSALATASLFAFATPIEAWLLRCPPLRWSALAWMRAALTATLAAQILALPLIMYHFGTVSLIAPLANVLLAPVLPLAMLLGGLTLGAGLIWLELGQIVALSAWLPLTWITYVTDWLAELSWAAMRLPPFPSWLLAGYYGLLGGWYVWQQWAEGVVEVEDVPVPSAPERTEPSPAAVQ